MNKKEIRPVGYRYDEGILYMWIAKEPTNSFKITLKGNIVVAYDFEGDVSIAEVNKGKQIFKDYEGL